MDEIRKCEILSYQNDLFDALYFANTLVNMTKTSCQDREFKGQYYGMNDDMLKRLSNERNEYIAMLTLISDKLSCILELNLSLEQEIVLHQNSNYSS